MGDNRVAEFPEGILSWEECVRAVEQFDPEIDYLRVLRSVVAHMRERAKRGANHIEKQ